MAAFTAADPDDRDAFDAWIARERAAAEVATYVVTENGGFAGTAALFSVEGDREVTYWIARHAWGRGRGDRGAAPPRLTRGRAARCSPAWPRTTRPRSLSSPRSGSPRSRATSTSRRVLGREIEEIVLRARARARWQLTASRMKRRMGPLREPFVVSCARGELNPHALSGTGT